MNKTSSLLYNRIYVLVRQVLLGRVTTYGRLAREIGCTARTVGFAMASLPAGHDIPWQRVINSRGEVSSRCAGDGDLIQRVVLEVEGCALTAGGGSICLGTAGSRRAGTNRSMWVRKFLEHILIQRPSIIIRKQSTSSGATWESAATSKHPRQIVIT